MNDNFVNLLHLSDIHFHKGSGDALDLDKDLRSKLEKDTLQMKNDFGEIAGILVTGDIVYSGQCDEYKKALSWLEQLCKLLGCKEQHVWVTPGNHDVKRDTIRNSKPLRDIHERLRNTDIRQLNSEIEETLRDQTYSEVIFEPIKDYIKFASRLSCDIIPSCPFWEDKITLNDGSKLCLRGLNSIIVSDENDNDRDFKLILGSHQAMLLEEPGHTWITLCHHPTDWFHDRDIITQILNRRSRIQLFGHKHTQWIELIDNGDHQTLRIIAGAVHPERSDSTWQPRYNYLSIAVEKRDGKRKLNVNVYSRVWGSDEMVFMPDLTSGDRPYRTFLLPLPDWDDPSASIEQKETLAESYQSPSSTGEKILAKEVIEFSPGESDMDAARRLAYRFLTLKYHEIMKIASELNLLEDSDDGLQDFELYKKLFLRAKGKGLLAELWKAVELSHGGSTLENPFTETKT